MPQPAHRRRPTIRSLEMDRCPRPRCWTIRELQDELAKALAALAQARDQDKKPVTIHFSRQGRAAGAHRVRRRDAGLEDQLSAAAVASRAQSGAADDAKTGRRPQGRSDAAAGEDAGLGDRREPDRQRLERRQLSLVSGRPISFIQDLYQPLYIPRPVVQPELFASLRPQTYEAGHGRSRRLRSPAADGQAPGSADGGGRAHERGRRCAIVEADCQWTA